MGSIIHEKVNPKCVFYIHSSQTVVPRPAASPENWLEMQNWLPPWTCEIRKWVWSAATCGLTSPPDSNAHWSLNFARRETAWRKKVDINLFSPLSLW